MSFKIQSIPREFDAMKYKGTDDSCKEIVSWMESYGASVRILFSFDGEKHIEGLRINGKFETLNEGDYVVNNCASSFSVVDVDLFTLCYEKTNDPQAAISTN